MKKLFIFAMLFLVARDSWGQSGIISTIAGTGISGTSGDGGAATAARIYRPSSAIADGRGNVYIVDNQSHRIRKVDSSGIISTIAGTGSSGYSGDGGAATSAQLSYPCNLALDNSGNVYIADQGNHSIRKVSVSGIITTVAGIGSYGFSGDGGSATAARLFFPHSIAFDRSGNMYVSDTRNNRIRKVSVSGIISTMVGSDSAGFSGDGGVATAARLNSPTGIAVDSSGNIYISDFWNYRIRKVSPTGIINTIAGNGTLSYSGDGGPATAAYISNLEGVALDRRGNLYLADKVNYRIRKISASGIINTIAGTSSFGYSGDNGEATAAKLNFPCGISVDDNGTIYFADQYNNRIRKIVFCYLPTILPITGPSSVNSGSTITLTDSTTGGTWSSSNVSRATVNSSGFVRGVSAGSVTISYTVSNACGTSRATKNVNIIAPTNAPAFTVGATSFTTACKNQSKIISDNIRVRDIDSGQTLTWSLYRAPRFGSANVAYSAISNRGVIRPPSDRMYSPNTNYVGNDTFIVRITDGTYSAYQTIYVTVNPLPTTPTIYGDSTLCRSASTSLTATPSGGSWARNTSNFSVSSSGLVTSITSGTLGFTDYITYYTAANSFGCKNSARHFITVPVMPASISITGSSVGTVGSTANYSSAIAGGAWSVRDSAIAYFSSGGVANFTGAGTTIISYTASRCGRTYNATKSVSVAAAKQQGIVKQEVTVTQEISVYPNPTTGELNIDLPMQQANLMLFDINGKAILMQEATSPHQQLDLNNYPKGIYMLVAAEGIKWEHRVILQ